MAQTAIEWTWTPRPDGSFAPGYTFNPWIGCTKVAPGCANCYAETLMDSRWGKVKWGPHGTRVRTVASNWNKVRQWDKEAREAGEFRRVFCASLADIFEDWSGPILGSKGQRLYETGSTSGNAAAVSMDSMRRDLFELIDRTQNLIWLLLTKRPENIERMWPKNTQEQSAKLWGRQSPAGRGIDAAIGRPNVWLGASISEQESADTIINELHKHRSRAPVLWLSAEPLLGPVDLSRYIPCEEYMPGQWRMHTKFGGAWEPMVEWIVVGGESAKGDHREFDCDWARSLRDQCAAAQVPFFFKQVDKVQDVPDDLMIRQSPIANLAV